jgi:hypothetical protein
LKKKKILSQPTGMNSADICPKASVCSMKMCIYILLGQQLQKSNNFPSIPALLIEPSPELLLSHRILKIGIQFIPFFVLTRKSIVRRKIGYVTNTKVNSEGF